MKQKEVFEKHSLITRFLSGEASSKETEELRKWAESSEENLLYLRHFKNIWDNSSGRPELDSIDTGKALDNITKQIRSGSSYRRLWSAWKKIAAILIIPLILGNILYLILSPSYSSKNSEPVFNELYAAFGTRSALKLSDGTSVWLNSGSRIKYPDRFKGSNRTIQLEGEAYFEVFSNPGKPFIVISPSLCTTAKGTKFNVNDYSKSEESGVTLVEGKIDVCRHKNGMNTGQSISLVPNQHFLVNNVTGDTSLAHVDTYKYISWKDGKIIFRNEPLSRVVQEIGKIYNVDIEIAGDEIKDFTYRATFEDESLEEILKLLKISSPVDYFESSRTPLPDGTFPKKKITIVPLR